MIKVPPAQPQTTNGLSYTSFSLALRRE